MNWLLIILLILVVWRAICGWRCGMAGEVMHLVALVAALIVLAVGTLLFSSWKMQDQKNMILSAIAIIIVGVLYRMVRFFLKTLKVIAELPIISILNSITGAAMGIAEVIVGMWICYLLLDVTAVRELNTIVMQYTYQNEWLTKLYEMNYVAQWMAGLS